MKRITYFTGFLFPKPPSKFPFSRSTKLCSSLAISFLLNFAVLPSFHPSTSLNRSVSFMSLTLPEAKSRHSDGTHPRSLQVRPTPFPGKTAVLSDWVRTVSSDSASDDGHVKIVAAAVCVFSVRSLQVERREMQVKIFRIKIYFWKEKRQNWQRAKPKAQQSIIPSYVSKYLPH